MIEVYPGVWKIVLYGIRNGKWEIGWCRPTHSYPKFPATMHADVVGLSCLIAEDEDGSYRVLRDRPAQITELVESRVRRAADCVGVSIQLEEAKSEMPPLAAVPPNSPPTTPF